MIRKLASAIRDQWIGSLALFLFAISGTAYAANTVFSTDIVDGEVKTADLANAAVTNAKLADNSVGKPKISAGAVENGKIADGAVGTSKLGAGAATNAKIADGAVNSQKVQNQTLTTDDLGPGSVDNNEIEFDAVTGAEVADGTLTGADIADGDLTGNEILEGGLTGHDIADESIQQNDLGSSVVTPKAMGVFEGTCVNDNNCPLSVNRGITALRRLDGVFGGEFCIQAGAFTDHPAAVIASQTSDHSEQWFAYTEYVSESGGPFQCSAGERLVRTTYTEPGGIAINHVDGGFTILFF